MSYRFRPLLPLLLLPFAGGAQQQVQETRYGLTGHVGSFVTKMSKAELAKDSYSFLVQADWSRRSPYAPNTFLGVTLLHGNSGGERYLGTVSAAMGFGDHNIAGNGWYSLRGRFALGLGWIQKPYDPVTNHKNTLLGSHLNAAVQASVYQQVKLGRHWSWNTGISFLHLSNGLSTLPNLGLNIPCIYTGLAWRKTEGPLPARTEVFTTARNQYAVWGGLGLKQWPLVNSPRRLMQIFSAEWSHRLSANGRWGAIVNYQTRSGRLATRRGRALHRSDRALAAAGTNGRVCLESARCQSCVPGDRHPVPRKQALDHGHPPENPHG
ncbi:MAG: hypothetical protein EOO15_08995 [Chitinophagaceae bacterium]|nr:MAG: hypothetical protein EOO15_08995 [Chitinophagaceae bacterium]